MSSLENSLHTAERTLDNAAKNILSYRNVAAFVLKAVITQFKDWSVKQIAEEALEADERNANRIRLLNVESNIPGEINTRFDLLFRVNLPDDRYVYMDLEFQRNQDNTIIFRALLYGAKIITSQEIRSSVPSLSTWVNMQPEVKDKNTIQSYLLEPYLRSDGLIEEPKLTALETYQQKGELSPIELNIINVGDPNSKGFDGIFKLLYLIFHGKIEVVADIYDFYGIQLSSKEEEEMQEYMSVTESYLNEGYQKGIKEGVEKITQYLMDKYNFSKKEAEDQARELFDLPKDEKPEED